MPCSTRRNWHGKFDDHGGRGDGEAGAHPGARRGYLGERTVAGLSRRVLGCSTGEARGGTKIAGAFQEFQSWKRRKGATQTGRNIRPAYRERPAWGSLIGDIHASVL